MTLTMQTKLTDFGLSYSDSVSDIPNKEVAKELLGKIFGALHWAPRFKKAGYKKKIVLLSKVRRFINKKMDSLPDLTDDHGNVMTYEHHFEIEQYFALCSGKGAHTRYYNDGLCAAFAGPGVAITYCEGDVTIYRGINAEKSAADHAHFWHNI